MRPQETGATWSHGAENTHKSPDKLGMRDPRDPETKKELKSKSSSKQKPEESERLRTTTTQCVDMPEQNSEGINIGGPLLGKDETTRQNKG